MGYFQVRYDSRVVNYDCRGFIRLATGTQVLTTAVQGLLLPSYGQAQNYTLMKQDKCFVPKYPSLILHNTYLLPTYEPTTYLRTYYLPTNLLPINVPTTYPRTYVPTYPRTYVPTYLRTHVPTYPRTYYLPTPQLSYSNENILRERVEMGSA